MRIRSFQSKLLLLVIGVLLLLEIATLLAVHFAGRTALSRSIGEDLRVGGRVLDEVLSNRAEQLSASLRVLALDFPFRQAVAVADVATIEDVLMNHGRRIGADALVLVSLDGSVIADTIDAATARTDIPAEPLIEIAGATGEAFATMTLRGEPYQFVVVPVLAPRPIAWLCAGFRIDDSLIGGVGALTSLDVSVSSSNGGAAHLITTLPAEQRDAFAGRASAFDSRAAIPATVTLAGEPYVTLVQSIETGDGSNVTAFLHRSLRAARRPFDRLQLQIFLFSLVALGGAIAAAIVFSRSVSRPVETLAAAAARIEAGDYATEIDVEQRDELGRLATAFSEMQSAIAAREEWIRHQSSHDELTGLPNRTLFLARIASAIDDARRHGSLVAMLMMDVDRFKEINDTLGHQFGDQLIVEIGRRLVRIVGSDETVARLGGDEFAVRFSVATIDEVDDVTRRITSAFDSPFVLGDVVVDVDASAGVALYPLHAGDAAELMRRADVAMYDAKKRQLRVALYESGRDENTLRRLSLMTELRQAIAHDELTIHFQPAVDVTTGRATRVEALVRWVHPKHGVMRPDEFIPLAEQSGNIGLITRWVLRHAIAKGGEWQRAGLDIAVAVNLSAVDLFDSELATYVRGLLVDAALPATKLTLEITESAVMKDPTHARKVLADLKSGGATIAVDDFGTGYSSLAQLKRLPVDELKIDKSFVQQLTAEATNDSVIVRSTIELAHNMGMKVVAEGVESSEAFEVLRRLGCDAAQGFWIGRPMPADDFARWLLERETERPRAV